jgi:hypothetical protein
MGKTNIKNVKNLKIELNNKAFKCVIGCSDSNNTNVFHVKLSSWIKHCDEIKDYKYNVNNIHRIIKNKFMVLSRDVFDDNFLFFFGGKKTLVKPDDLFYGCFEFTLKQLPNNDKNIFELKTDVERIMNKLTDMIVSLNNFEFYNNKTGNYVE